MTFLPNAATPGEHRCATCSKTYSTNSHLRRHEATHSGRPELTCTVCDAQFSRRDLARRHIQNCTTHSHEVVLPFLKRGRKRIACDRCSQRKLLCDTREPCLRCRSGGTRCTYERLSLACSSATERSDLDKHPTHRKAGDAEANVGGECGLISFDFLLSFTNPSGFRPSAAITAEAVDLQTIEHKADSWDPQNHSGDHHTVHGQPFCEPGDSSSVFFGFPFPVPEKEDRSVLPVVRGCLTSDLETTSVLEARLNELLSQLSAKRNSMLECDSDTKASFDLQLAKDVFTVANVRLFVCDYFHYFHDQFPVLHKPTFDSQTASLALLLTVVLFGSMASYPSDVSIAIRQFFDVAEAYIFDHLISKHLLHEACNIHHEIELLQAALLFLMVQNNSNDLTTRRRLRSQRIPTLVAAVRASGLFAYKRQHLVTGKDRPEWRLFVFDELRLRVAVWTFMTDSTLAIFFNSPPRVAMSEMMGSLPCGEDLFRAETAVEFEHAISLGLLGTPMCTFPRLMSTVLISPLSEPPAQTEETVTGANMLILVCALQSVVMTSRMNYLASATVEVILHALDRWKDIWDVVNSTGNDGIESQKGFERHAGEYWWLARMILKIGQSGDQSCRYLQFVPSDSAEDLHDFVRKYKDYLV